MPCRENGDNRRFGMNEVNREVLFFKPKVLFLDWVNSADDEGVVLTLGEVALDGTVYLTPEIEDDDELREFLEKNYEMLFEQELAGWVQDEARWPANRDISTFLDWFDIEFHSMVIDVAGGELKVVADDV